MVNKKLGLGILVMVLVFGMMGCSEDDSDDHDHDWDVNILDEMGLQDGSPNTATLSAFGLNATEFNTIKALVTGYKGYVIEGDNRELTLAWTGRSQDNFNTVAAQLKTMFTATEEHANGDNGVPLIIYGRVSSKKRYEVFVYTRKSASSGPYYPAGTLLVNIYQP